MRTIHYALAVTFALFLAAGTAGAQEGPGNSGCRDADAVLPGPNGCNNYGLCMAFFAGSDQGRGNKRNAPPFAELINQACMNCDCEEMGEDACVADFCPDSNPAGNGRNPSDGSPGQGNGNG